MAPQQQMVKDAYITLVSLPGGGSLLRIKTTSTIYLVRQQVWTMMVIEQGISEGKFRARCKDAKKGSPRTYVLGPELVKHCTKAGALKPRGGNHILLTLAQIKWALTSVGIQQSHIQSMHDAIQGMGTPLVEEAACLNAHDPAGGSMHPSSWEVGSFPTRLLEDPPKIYKRQRLSLTHTPAMGNPGLQLQLDSFSEFYSIPVELSRNGGPLLPISQGTIIESLLLFLGYLHLCCHVRLPNLQHCVQPELVMSYVSSRVMAGMSRRSLGKDCDALIKVVPFWCSMAGGGEQIATQMAKVDAWLRRLRMQVRRAIPRVRLDFHFMVSAGKWVTAGALLKVFEACRIRVLAKIQAHRTRHPDQALTLSLAQRLQAALFVNFLFGYLPPTRLQCVMTMTLPSSNPTCQQEGCRLGPACMGNRLDRQGSQVGMVFPHHKNATHWGSPIVLRSLPTQLAELCVLYFDLGIPTLHHHFPEAQQHRRVFFQIQGSTFKKTMSPYFQKVLQLLGFPPSVHIPPQNLRHIFVQERRGPAAAVGPSDVGASMVMGSSPRTLTLHYQTSRWDGSQAQAAADSMVAWRAALLQDPARGAMLASRPVAMPELVGGMSDSESSLESESEAEGEEDSAGSETATEPGSEPGLLAELEAMSEPESEEEEVMCGHDDWHEARSEPGSEQDGSAAECADDLPAACESDCEDDICVDICS